MKGTNAGHVIAKMDTRKKIDRDRRGRIKEKKAKC